MAPFFMGHHGRLVFSFCGSYLYSKDSDPRPVTVDTNIYKLVLPLQFVYGVLEGEGVLHLKIQRRTGF